MRWECERGRGVVSGQRVRAEKLERAREFRRAPTAEERMLWSGLRAGRLGGYHFRRQQVIDGLIVDFFCAGAGLVVEVDGPVHGDQAAYDAARDAILGERGLKVLRVSIGDVDSGLEEVLVRIRARCEERAEVRG